MTGDYQNNCGTLTTTNAILNTTSGNYWGGQTTTTIYPYPYTAPATTYYYWPTYVPVQDTQMSKRVAELEGEVKVLREMVAALVGGGQLKPKAKRSPVKKRKV